MIKNSVIERLNDKIKSLTETGTLSKSYEIKLSKYETKIT